MAVFKPLSAVGTLSMVIALVALLVVAPRAMAQGDGYRGLLLDQLAACAETSAVTGREAEAADFIRALVANPAMQQDALGNLFLVLGSGEPRRLLTAPLDEPGYVISQIQADGYLRLNPLGSGYVGNLYDQFLEGHVVRIQTASGPVDGVSTVPSAHFEGLRTVRERDKAPFQWQEAYLDVGAASAAEVRAQGIELLDPVTWRKQPTRIGDRWLAAPALRAKAAAVALAAVANSLAGQRIEGTLVIAWTTLELLNGKGLETIVNRHGPFQAIHRFNRFLLSDRAGVDTLLSNGRTGGSAVATRRAIPVRSFRTPSATIDYAGLPIYEIGLPCWYGFTPVETVAITDVERLIAHWLRVAGYSGPPKPFAGKPGPVARPKARAGSDGQALLAELIGAYGVSSAEAEVRQLILSKLPVWAQPTVDEKGNVVLRFGQGEDHVVFVAHMDETGYLVDSIYADGRLQLRSRGGMLPWVWEAQPAIVHGIRAKINGVFEPRPDYLAATTRAAATPLVVNAGFATATAARTAGIEAGVTTVTMPKELLRLNEHRATARAFDDRVGCAALLLSLQDLDPDLLAQRVTMVWSVGEEIGLIGASFVAPQLRDARVVHPIDTYVSSDDPYGAESFAGCPLGAGAVIRVLESINFISRANLRRMQGIAAQHAVPVQYGMTAGGTDGQPFLGFGIPSIPLSWPGRYSHSPVEVMDFRDMDSLVRLISGILHTAN